MKGEQIMQRATVWLPVVENTLRITKRSPSGKTWTGRACRICQRAAWHAWKAKKNG